MDPLALRIINCDRPLGWYLRCSRVTSASSEISIGDILVLITILPTIVFAVFWYITSSEFRFDLGSLDLPNPVVPHYRVAGLSFLGDTMVWPFFLLVPLLLVLLRGVVGKTATLMNSGAVLANLEVLHDREVQADCSAAIGRALAALCYEGLGWRLLRWLAILLGLGLFAYNTIACLRADAWPNTLIRYDSLPNFLKPYQSHKAILKPDAVVITLKDPAPLITPCADLAQHSCLPPSLAKKLTVASDRRQFVFVGPLSNDERQELASLWPGSDWQQAVQAAYSQIRYGISSEIMLPVSKWDTDAIGAPYSWLATRGWVFFLGYTIIPLAVLRVFNIIFTMRRMVAKLASLNVFKVNPYSPESSDNLNLIVNVFWACNYCLLVVSIMVALAFFKVGIKPEWYDLVLVLLIPIFAYAAIGPLVSISNVFEKEVKRRYLAVHVDAAEQMHREFHDLTKHLDTGNRAKCAEALTKYDEYLSRGEAASLFPFSAKTITNVIAPVTPLILALLEKALSILFG